jgi:flagellar hook-associated protein 2
MASGVISVGGLATGLDTNTLIQQLVQIQSRPIQLLQNQLTDAQATQTSLTTLGTKLSAIQTAADAIKNVGDFLVRKASSSDDTILSAAAGSGAAAGSVTLNVSKLAHGSVASSANGVGSATSTIANGNGFFKFTVGSGSEQSVPVSATTTLQDLVTGINNLGAGVTASAVNLGTAASPDYRLQLTSNTTGASSTIAVTHDDTTLGVTVTQAGQNAEFTITGFTGTFKRESNTFSDVLPGVTFSLKSEGIATVTVTDDADAIVTKVKALVTAFNDAVGFVGDQSTVTSSTDANGNRTVAVGSLANSSTASRLIDSLHNILSEPLNGATTQYVNLASVGFKTQEDGTIAFDESAFRTALSTNPTAVAQLFGGNGTGAGVANDLSSFVDNATGVQGAISLSTNSLNSQIQEIQDEIDAAQRQVDAFQADLKEQFTALETLVSGLQSQGSFLTQAINSGTIG